MAQTTEDTATLERIWGSIPSEIQEHINTLVSKRLFESKSAVVRQALTDLCNNYQLFLLPIKKQ